MQELLGTRTSADINLVAQIIMLTGLWVGFYFIRTKQRTKHANMQTSVVLVQLFFISFVMVTSFYNYIISGGTTTGTVARLMMVHGFLGLIAEVSGIYLILRMRTQVIPERLRVRNFKLVMRATLGLWTIIAVLGIATYYYRYLAPESTSVTAPLVQLRQAGDDLLVHAVELHDAADRKNLQTTKRHAEHLINLIEGKSGDHYGDVDKDGAVEDPGDGTGLLNYVRDVERAADERDIDELAKTVRELLEKIDTDALSVIQATDLASVETLATDARSLALRANSDGIIPLEIKAKEAGVRPVAVTTSAVPGAMDEPNTVTIVLNNFQFMEKSVTIKKGWTVQFINQESPKHTATADDDTFNSGRLSRGDTFTFTFDQTGTFPYYCRFHGDKSGVGMAGMIIVE